MIKLLFTFLLFILITEQLEAQTLNNQTVVAALNNLADETKYFHLSSGTYFTQSAFTGVGNDKTMPGYGQYDSWIVRLNESFGIDQQYVIGGDDFERLDYVGEFYNGDLLISISTKSDSSGNLITSGDSANLTYDEVILRMHPNGYIRWQTRIGGLGHERINDVVIDHDTVWLFGFSYSDSSGHKLSGNYGGSDYWLVGMDEWGQVMVDETYGGSLSDVGESILIIGNEIFLSGTSNSPAGSGNKTVSPFNSTSDSWLLKVNKKGEILDQKNIGGSGLDQKQRLVYKNETQFFQICESLSPIGGDKNVPNYGSFDYWIVEMDTAFNLLSQKNVGGSSLEKLTKVEYHYGDYFLIGSSKSDSSGNLQIKNEGEFDLLFMAFDSNFNVKSTVSLGGTENDYLYDVCVQEPGKLVFCAGSYSYFSGDKKAFNYANSSDEQGWLFTMNLALNEPEKQAIQFLQVFPNPSAEEFNVKIPDGNYFDRIIIYNQNGIEMFSTDIKSGQLLFHLETSDWPQGAYYCHLMGNEIKVTERLIIK